MARALAGAPHRFDAAPAPLPADDIRMLAASCRHALRAAEWWLRPVMGQDAARRQHRLHQARLDLELAEMCLAELREQGAHADAAYLDALVRPVYARLAAQAAGTGLRGRLSLWLARARQYVSLSVHPW